MTDTRTPEQRRRIMAAVRSSDTAPELQLRRALYAAGVRGWRCNYKGAPGKPDLAWPSLRIAVFVDGAFWHGHPSRHRPGRSGSYWDEKIARNVERDREADAALENAGWTVVREWDFEIARDPASAVERVSAALRTRAGEGAEWQRRLARPESHRERSATTAGRPSNRLGAGGGSFGQELRDARLRAGLSRSELAAAAGLQESTVRLYESGAREPRASTVAKLARALSTLAPAANSAFSRTMGGEQLTAVASRHGTPCRPSCRNNTYMSRQDDPDHHTRAQAFGENLREARKSAGISQEELAERAGVDRSAINDYERGRCEPNLSTIVKLAHAMVVSAEVLVRGL